MPRPQATLLYSLILLLFTGLFFSLMLWRGATLLGWVLRASERLRKQALYNVLHGEGERR